MESLEFSHERSPEELIAIRAVAFGVIAPKYEDDKFVGYNFGIGLFEALGLTEDEARMQMAELAEILDQNLLPGGVVSLPEYDPNIPPTGELVENTPMLRETAYFILGYIEQAGLGDDGNVIDFLGRKWLGNSLEETRTLIERFLSEPESVSSFLRWAFNNDPHVESMIAEFEKRAKNNDLELPHH